MAIHAFIPYENFDNTFSYSSIFLSIWKVREDLNIAGLGLRTIKFIENNLEIKPILIQALGYAKEVSPLYEKLGYTIGKLSHYVLINTTLDSFEILEKEWLKYLRFVSYELIHPQFEIKEQLSILKYQEMF